MPYKDPAKRREKNRRWRENFQARDPEGYREYMRSARERFVIKHGREEAQRRASESRRRWWESLTAEQRQEHYRKVHEWKIRTGRIPAGTEYKPIGSRRPKPAPEPEFDAEEAEYRAEVERRYGTEPEVWD